MERVYRAALEKWGVEAQYDQTIEECAELIAALKHFKRGKVDEEQIVSELADVTLMIGQLAWMFGEERVKSVVARKLEKLAGLLDAP
jgi:NTP pyrophosphatase (non-canonical NTP hydrolase)